MKALSWLKYFVYFLLIILTIWLKGAAEAAYQSQYMTTYTPNYLLYTIVVLLPIVVGAVFGLEAFLKERAKPGEWKINLPKLVFIALPSFLVSMIYFIVLIPNETLYKFTIVPLINFFGSNTSFVLFFQIFLGYALITICNKKEILPEGSFDEEKPFDEVYEKQENVEEPGEEEVLSQAEEAEAEVTDISEESALDEAEK